MWHTNDGDIVFGLVMRGIALCNLLHFFSFYRQISGLVGDNGLQPAKNAMNRVAASMTQEQNQFKKYVKYPTIYWLSTSNSFLEGTCLFGVSLSAFLLFFPLSPMGYMISAVLCYSLSLVLGPFNLQMEPMMVEINALCFIGSLLAAEGYSLFAVAAFRSFIIRIMLSAGFVKWNGSKKWKDLTAMQVHYITQPLPNPVSYYIHFFPALFHKFSTFMSLVIELPVSCIALIPFWPCRVIAFIGYVGLMGMINITGNYGNLGLTTDVLSISLLDDWMLSSFLSAPAGLSMLPLSKWFAPFFVGDLMLAFVCFVIVMGYIVISAVPLLDTTKMTLQMPYLSEAYEFLRSYRVMNRYGMFGAMHEKRWELIVEGSNDKQEWRRYMFYYKACDVSKAPRQIWELCYWPRLDWHLWFIPLHIQRGNTTAPPWYLRFLGALLKGEKDVLQLLELNPFPDAPPQFVRTQIFEYSFEPDRTSKNWWTEKLIGTWGVTNLENLADFGQITSAK